MVLVGVDFGLPHFDHALEELGLLAETAGFRVAERVTCKRRAPDPALFVGSGKADEVKALLDAKADVVVLDADPPESERARVLRAAAMCPTVAIAVSGGGSGTGIAALINGTVDIANSSRDMHTDEREEVRRQTGKNAVDMIITDLAVFARPDRKGSPFKLIETAPGVSAADVRAKTTAHYID